MQKDELNKMEELLSQQQCPTSHVFVYVSHVSILTPAFNADSISSLCILPQQLQGTYI